LEGRAKPRLLIVEDDKENQKFLSIFLRKIFEFDICDSAESVYLKLRERKYDIILMDISLKGTKDGLQITRELRSNPEYQNMPIVGLSAHAFQKDKENAYKAGVDIFITKPVRGHILIESLATVLKQKTGIRLD
jgi:CheY-like chemotaxis protein